MGFLKNKTAFITGGGQGIGFGIARALAAQGAHVALMGRTKSKCEHSRDELATFGIQSLAVCGDVMDKDSMNAALTQVTDEFGGLDILVNNAQFVPNGRLLDLSDTAFMDGFISGPLASLRLMKQAHPYLKAREGHIINILSSVMKRWNVGGYGGYAAVKAATQQLTRAAANEWGADGIRVNAIMPHGNSPALKGWMERNPQEAQAFQKSIPLGRVGDCETDIGAFVALMCAPQAAYLSGQTIALDGGQVFTG